MVDTASKNGNGAHPDAGESLPPFLWDGLAPAVVRALEEPLDPALVSHRKGRANKTLPYLEGHTVIDEANRIFGFGGWGYELAGDVTLRRIESLDSRTGEVSVAHAYSAPVRVTVAGALPRTDVGFHAVAEDTAEGHDTAVKGAVTDGMKRALRSFGARFGNGLYGDQPASRETSPAGNTAAQRNGAPSSGTSGDAAETARLRTQLVELGAQQGFDEARLRTAVRSKTGKDIERLTARELVTLVEAAARKLAGGDVAEAA